MNGENPLYLESCMLLYDGKPYLPELSPLASLLTGSWFTWFSKKDFGNFVQLSSHAMNNDSVSD